MSDCVVTASNTTTSKQTQVWQCCVSILQKQKNTFYRKHFMDVPKLVDNLIYLQNHAEGMQEK